VGYFDGLASGAFKKDESGRTIFYPWGVLGRGRLLPDEAAEKKSYGFIKLYFQIALPLIVLGAVFNWMYALALLPILLVWYYLKINSLVSTYPVVDAKLTMRESYAGSAAAHGKGTLWALFVVSSLFVIAAAWIALSGSTTGDKLIGVAGILLFGLAAIAIGYMLKARTTG
jgi:hypothetical protein